MTDDPVTECTTCDAKVQRVMHPVAVHFKGSGFYTTDYARKGKSGGAESSSSSELSDAGKNGSDKSGSTSTKADKADKPDSKATSSSSKKDSSD